MSTTIARPSLPTNGASAIPVGANEELAGPPHLDNMRPIAASERISSVDVLRGFALMGILLCDITDFAMPGWNYIFPLDTVKPVFSGPHWHINTICWFLRWLLAEGKMRSLFSMLFGAGVILLTRRAEERGAGIRAADIYTRRNMWLVVFGVIHCLFIWNGDILFFYGLSALIFLFPFRNLKPKPLILSATIVLLLNTLIIPIHQTMRSAGYKREAAQANIALAHHQVLTTAQIAALKDWKTEQDRWRPGTEKLYANIEAHQHGYLSQRADLSDAMSSELGGAHTFGDYIGLMLLGMALFRIGFFSLKCTTRTYVLTAVIGMGISLPLTFWGCWHAWRSGFDMFASAHALLYPYDLTRVAGALGNAALFLLLVRSGLFRWMLARVAAIGQMALSNYILNSLVMRTLFVWSPLHWYGYVEYYKLYYIVGAEWIVNLAFSSIWLRHFRFGPLEWCWRSLTYWKRQPMLLHAPSDSGVPAAAVPAVQG